MILGPQRQLTSMRPQQPVLGGGPAPASPYLALATPKPIPATTPISFGGSNIISPDMALKLGAKFTGDTPTSADDLQKRLASSQNILPDGGSAFPNSIYDPGSVAQPGWLDSAASWTKNLFGSNDTPATASGAIPVNAPIGMGQSPAAGTTAQYGTASPSSAMSQSIPPDMMSALVQQFMAGGAGTGGSWNTGY